MEKNVHFIIFIIFLCAEMTELHLRMRKAFKHSLIYAHLCWGEISSTKPSSYFESFFPLGSHAEKPFIA